MKKYLKIVNILLIFTVIFAIIIATQNVALSLPETTVPTAQTTQQQVKSPGSIPAKNAYALTHMEHKGFKYAVVKFLLAMLGVAISAAAIWMGLKLYKKLMLKNNLNIGNIDYDKTLESPKDFKDAINQFLHKTDK